MALRYENLVKTVKEKPLTVDQINHVFRIEQYIDEKLSKWDPLDWHSFSIDLCIAKMEYDPFSKVQLVGWDTTTKQKMMKMLDDLYIDAGWKIEKKIDDSMHAQDEWILKHK